jgi:serine/threonine protein kinase
VAGAALLLTAALAPPAIWALRKGGLLWVAGIDAKHVQTVADRARYTSMGAIVVLTATAAAASLTLALTLVFSGHSWVRFLPAGLLWGVIVFSFDRWIVSSLDYGPLTTAEETKSAHRSRSMSKAVQFLVRLTMAALVGLVISEPIVLAVFGPEISQQLSVQHTIDASKLATQIDAGQRQQLAILNRPVAAANATLAAATAAADNDRKIYLCELTGQLCDLPPGEVTGQAGAGPQSSLDYAAWQRALLQQEHAQQVADQASTTERAAAAALAAHTSAQLKVATATVDADNGLLAREKALDTLSQQNPGFLLRRLVLWLALMFIDLTPVLLKTFSPRTLYEVLIRTEAIRIARNAVNEAVADSDHESAKKAITREFDLEYHRAVTGLEYSLRLEAARAGQLPGRESLGRTRRERAGQVSRASQSRGTKNGVMPRSGWVIGRRWQIQRPLADADNSRRVPFVATDLYGEYPFEVVVKIIAPEPRVAGNRAVVERRHAQMEMSLPLGYIHDNIAEVLDADLDPEHGFYIVTQLYPGTLERQLRAAEERNALSVGQVLRLSTQILAGLRAAWDRGFVHLDLKPANIAIAADGTVKLIDFGLAQRYQEADGGNGTTTTARFTPFYAPPEQMERRDTGWISRYADLRALGAVMYRMLTGYPPIFREARALGLVDSSGLFDAATYVDVKDLVATVEPVPVGELIPDLPQELDMLMRTWLRTDPQMRCPGKAATMPERAWVQLAAVAEQVRAVGRSDDPVGRSMTREPELTELRVQWRNHLAIRNRERGRRETLTGDARSGETLEAVQATPGYRDRDLGTAASRENGAGALHWWSAGEDDTA